ncbi:polyamine-transporting ATPase 13A3-like isoform X2 [Lycorma delicatula]|uniref:polyamine-transporting ATPase 13A3-like isoform X2 n=1 Tax=Lycorma delicatula TaxID=130591 RepID=UPI003F51AB0D
MAFYTKLLRSHKGGYEDITSHFAQNIDLEEEYTIFCTGYQRNWKHKLFQYSFYMVFVGIPYLLLKWYPQFEVNCFWKKCTLENAQIILVKDSVGTCSLHKVFESVEWSDGSMQRPLRYFIYKLQRFIWCHEKLQFQQMKGLADGVRTVSNILQLGNGLSLCDRQKRLKVFGDNNIVFDIKSYWQLLVDEVLNPFYIFELFSIILWIFDEYYFYAIFIAIISAGSIQVSLLQTKKQCVDLKQMASLGFTQKVIVHTSDGGSFEESSDKLVPGDVVEIPPHGCMMMCDALLLSGTCVVNESSLTGESVPVIKIPLPYSNEVYKPKSLHARHTLFCGTQILQTRYYENNKVLAVVTQTGCNTAKGELIRLILHPKQMAFDFMVESIRFVFLLFMLASIAMLYSAHLYILHGASLETLLLRTLDIITIVVPPTLPAAMTVGTVYSQKRLKKQGIFCISPARILISGKTSLVCFDKTGTLTEEGMDLWGVLPSTTYSNISSSSFHSEQQLLTDDHLIKDVKTLDNKSPIKIALASCHSLTVIDNEICGDPLDITMFKATDWELEEPGEDTAKYDMLIPTIVRPKQNISSRNSSSDDINTTADIDVPLEIGLIRQFPFTSSAQNMTVISRILGARNMTVFSKGAPEKIIHLCNINTIPANIDNILGRFTAAGYRVIALAYKELPTRFTWTQAHRVTRDQIEDELHFIGLLLMQNNLKPASEPVIRQLKMARIKCIMITGDNMMTAVSVSRECGILSPECHVVSLYINRSSSTPKICAESLHGAESNNINLNDIYTQLVMDGNTWSFLKTHFPLLVDAVTVKTVVFARMSPQQKTQIIEFLQGLDYFVMMCGDGANDCGALKAAHVGISLSQTETSIVAPFTYQKGNINCVLELIKEGRCALVTSFGLFNFMTMYSLIQFISVIVLYRIGTEVGTMEFLYIDLVVTTSLVMTMGKSGPSDTLIIQQPITSLISVNNILPLSLQILLVLIFQLLSLYILELQPWYIPVVPAKHDEEVVLCWENTVVYSVSCFQYLILAFLYSRGKPHRQSFYKNWLMLIIFVLLVIFTTILTLYPPDKLSNAFEMEIWTPRESHFRIWLIILSLIHFIISFFIETIFAEKMATQFLKNKNKLHKKKYKAIEDQLQSGMIWCSL